MWKIFVVLTVLCSKCRASSEGDNCDINGEAGVCAKLTGCESAKQALQEGRKIVICDVVNFKAIVCCFDVSPVNPVQNRPLVTTTTPRPATLANIYTTLLPAQQITPVTNQNSLEMSCRPTLTAVLPDKPVCSGELIFSEEFSVNIVEDLAKWQAEFRFISGPDFPFNMYAPYALTVEDGSLVIRPSMTTDRFGQDIVTANLNLNTRCTGKKNTSDCVREALAYNILSPVITGKLTTRDRFAFKFGRIDIRAKLPAGDWLCPELNLEPRDNLYGTENYESGLLRVAFARGNSIYTRELFGGAILDSSEPMRSQYLKRKESRERWTDNFHIYTLIWSPDKIKVQVDGETYGTIYPEDGFYRGEIKTGMKPPTWLSGTAIAPFDQFFYISLGLTVGGINDFKDTPEKPWKGKQLKALYKFWNGRDVWLPTWKDAELRVDYVRVFAL